MITKKSRFAILIFLFFSFLLVLNLLGVAIAHEGEENEAADEHEVADAGVAYPIEVLDAAWAGMIFLAIFALAVVYSQDRLNEKHKKILYSLLAVIVGGITAYFIFTTLYTNLVSETKGPVHWHADFEIWNCGEKIELAKPEGLSNRVGTELFHEHGDNRIHVEGPVVKSSHVDIHSFIEVVGGEIGDDFASIPTGNGNVEMRSGNLCNGREGRLQVFVYKTVNAFPAQKGGFVFEQIKLDDFKGYVLSPYSNVPPGDCIIIEFDEDKDKTDKICDTYGIEINK